MTTARYTHKKQSGGSGQYAKIKVTYEPNPGEGFEFDNQCTGAVLPPLVLVFLALLMS